MHVLFRIVYVIIIHWFFVERKHTARELHAHTISISPLGMYEHVLVRYTVSMCVAGERERVFVYYFFPFSTHYNSIHIVQNQSDICGIFHSIKFIRTLFHAKMYPTSMLCVVKVCVICWCGCCCCSLFLGDSTI